MADITIAAIMALVAVGAYLVQQEGMALQWLPVLWAWLPGFWQKPFWTCPTCMVSVWGIPTWMLLADAPWSHLPVHLFVAACIANGITKYLDL